MSEQVTQYYCKIDPIKTGEKIQASIVRSNIQIKELAKISLLRWVHPKKTNINREEKIMNAHDD